MVESRQYKLLVVDDNGDIHKDFTKILTPNLWVNPSNANAINELDEEILGKAKVEDEGPTYHLDFAFQGEEALKKVNDSILEKNPYALIFMDVLMPPGWDGIKTIQKIWEVDSYVNVVICTAYADYSWEDIVKQLGTNDKFLILKKPFENIEVRQMACCLTNKWFLSQQAGHKYDRIFQEVIDETEKLKKMFDNVNKKNQ